MEEGIMKKKVIGLALGLLMMAAMLLASCGTSNTTSTTTSTVATSTTAEGVVLTVTNGSAIKTYSLADLQALTPVTGNGGSIINGLSSYQGVALTDLLNAVGGIAEGQSVTITGAHNYSMTLTYDQITNVSFNFYDTSGNPVTPTTKPVLAVIYSVNGAPLVSYRGPTELGLLSTQNLVSDASMWLESLMQIDIIHTP
jgi:hypothetical protein